MHLAAYHGNWYVLAYVKDRDKPLTFALSRFRSLAMTGESFIRPEKLDIKKYIQESFGITHGDREIHVRLRFAKSVAVYIAERHWHPTQKMHYRKDGSLELSFTTRGWKELVRWILSWQPDVTVVAPRELRDRVNEKIRLGLLNSRGNSGHGKSRSF